MSDRMHSGPTTLPARAEWHDPVNLVAVVSGLALVLIVALSRHALLFDEPTYMRGAELLVRGASLHQLLVTPLNTPAGPLYPVLHWLLSPVTGLAAPYVRGVNVTLLGVTIAALAATLRQLRYDRPGARAAMLIGVPTVWVVSGMALTEMPAVTAMSLSLLAASWAMAGAPDDRRRIWTGFAAAGIAFGLAVLGRQPYLPAVVGFAMIALFAPAFRWPAVLALVLALAVPAPVFAIWHGFVPADTRYTGARIMPEYGALGLAYTAVFVAILAPRYFLARWRLVMAASAVTALAILLAGGVSLQIAAGVTRHLPPSLGHVVQLCASMALTGAGTAFVLVSVVNMWERRSDRRTVLLILLSLGLALTPALVSHQFSSRYLMMTFPFLLLAVQPFCRPSAWAAVRVAAGAAFGLLSLNAYLLVF